MKTLNLVILLIASASLAFAEQDHPLAKDNAVFALDLYGRLRTQPGNLFFSPHSISTALAMTYGGARGKTSEQMAQALHFELPQEKLHPAFAAMERDLAEIQKKGKVKLAVANSLWPQKKFELLPGYLALCEKNYGTKITPLDFMGTTEQARQTINNWVEDKTNKKITGLFPSGSLDPMTRLVLVNAIYFKGDWSSPFKAAATQKQPFHISGDKTSEASLMHQKRKFGYAERDGLQILEMPYVDDDISMVVLLPKNGDGLTDIERSLTEKLLSTWLSALDAKAVEVFLPKFKMTSQFSLGGQLAALGMPDAFSGKADFSGMDGQRDLFISAVVHKAFVEVNEEGTEAAAATGVAMAQKSRAHAPEEVPVFRADHPFLFLIRDTHTGSIPFLGRIVNPAA